MSVRRRQWRDPATGVTNEVWMVDVDYQHPDGRRQRIRKVSPVQTRRGAEQYERELRDSLLEGTFGRKEVAFKQLAQEFLDVYVKGQLKWATQITYKSTVEAHLLPELKNLTLEEITTQRIHKLMAKLKAAELSKHTMRNTVGVLSRMLHIAKEWGYLATVPEIPFPKVPTPKFRFLSEEERRAVLENAGPYWYGPVYFALMTGCRQGEIWALEREQLDLVNGVVTIDRAVYRGKVGLPKHDRIRSIELSAGLISFLKEQLKIVPLKHKVVFPTEEGTIRQERKADQGLRRVAKRAGVDPFAWHVLRHTFASHLAMKGVPLQVIQQLMGHARIEETMRYAHINPRMKRDAVGYLDELGAGSGTAQERHMRSDGAASA